MQNEYNSDRKQLLRRDLPLIESSS